MSDTASMSAWTRRHAGPWIVLASVLTWALAGCGEGPGGDPPPAAEPGPDGSSPATTVEQPDGAAPPARVTGDTTIEAFLAGPACVPPGDRGRRMAQEPVTGTPRERVAQIVALERELATAGDAEAPGILMRLGQVKMGLAVGRGGDLEAFGWMRSDFGYNEPYAEWSYRGTDYEELLRRYPDSDMADDVAYEMSLRPTGGECEGWVDCYVSRGWYRAREFLVRYPDSPLAPLAVDRALNAFDAIPGDQELQTPRRYYEPTGFRRLAASLDSVGRMVRPPQGTRMLERVARVWWQLAERETARSTLGEAVTRAQGDVRACLQGRLDALPTVSVRLRPPEVVHPGRVVLNWDPPSTSVSGYAIYRGTTDSDLGELVGRPDIGDTEWIDESTGPGILYWYTVVAESAEGEVRSNATRAETPSYALRVEGASISETDRFLHVFGLLSTTFPQVVRISPDGSTVERRDAFYVGVGRAWNRYQDLINEVFLAEPGKPGVLSGRGPVAVLPSSLVMAAQRGVEILQRYPDPENGTEMLVSVAEADGSAWIELEGGFTRTPWYSMDCAPAPAVCWLGEREAGTLRNLLGLTIARFELPNAAERRRATATYVDPTDGSAWFLYTGGRLAHVGTDRSVLADVELGAPSPDMPLMSTASLERDRTIWVLLRRDTGNDLARIDVDEAEITPVVVVPGASLGFLIVDLEGGVWLVNSTEAVRYDRDGEPVVRVPLR